MTLLEEMSICFVSLFLPTFNFKSKKGSQNRIRVYCISIKANKSIKLKGWKWCVCVCGGGGGMILEASKGK